MVEKEQHRPPAAEKSHTKAPEPSTNNSTSESLEAAGPKEPKGMSDAGIHFPIVGIGASAGGLDALEQFFTHLPATPGMAFVVVQHLDPTHKSILADLVQRQTRMEVFEVEDGVKVQPNCVYIIPPDKDMGMMHASLHLTHPTARRGLRLPIDFLFRSLAHDQHERAIGIVLSGTGSDGTLGLKAVKEEGGMVMVQDPETAKYDGMPRRAIATGLVDVVLPPNEMAKQLIAYVRHAFGRGIQSPPLAKPESKSELLKVFIQLRTQTGHDFSGYKPTTILRRIERRMMLYQLERLADYVRYLQENPAEVQTLFKELLIGVSNFFRDPDAFTALKEKVIPALFKSRSMEPIRVWVPGCATGEEAYSIAILIREQVELLKQDVKAQIFATDIDSTAIEVARGGEYPSSIAADVSPERLRRFFAKKDGAYQVNKTLREMLIFAEQNIIKDPPFSKLDLISCRNLLIYMGVDLQKKVFPLFHYALMPDGYLFLGSSETIGELTDLFGVIDRKWKLFQRKEEALSRKTDLDLPILPLRHGVTGLGAGVAAETRKPPSFREVSERQLLERYAPAAVLIDNNGAILYVHGQTGKYLELAEGEANLNIVRMAREGLGIDLTTAIRKAAAQKKAIRYEGIRVKTNDHDQTINLTVTPVPKESGLSDAVLVAFEEAAPAPARPREPDQENTQRAEELERELRSTKEYLQTTIEELETSNEELKSTNEELQSSNEELQSTNEEMETSKEELQSVNEELVTVNSEHEVKLEDLAKSNNDLANLLASTDVGILFLDLDFRIRRFTPTVTEVINLIPTDLGRPLGHIVSNLEEDLVHHARKVLDTLVLTTKEVRGKDGRWYLMRVVPYRTVENAVDGIVMTFVDLTEQKRMQFLERLATVVRDSNDAITVQDSEGRILAWNRGAERMYGWTETEALAMHIQDTVPEDKRQEALSFVKALATSEAVESFETQRITKDGRRLDVWLTGTTLAGEEGEPAMIATTERDITEHRRAKEALQKSERRLSLALDGAQMGIWEWDVRANRLVWNPREYELLGLPVGAGDVDTETFFARVHPEDLPELRALLARAVEQGEEFTHEFRIVRPDGEVRWLTGSGRVFRDSTDQAARMLGVNYDITVRKRAEQVVAEEERKKRRKRVCRTDESE